MKTTTRWRVAQHFEIKWWRNYLKNKDVNAYLKWKKEYWHSFLKKIEKTVKLEEGVTVLDAGCGPAGIFTVLDGYTTTAIDPLLEEYDINIPHFKKKNYPNTTFHTISLEEYSEVNKFDIVFCINAVNHVSDLSKAFQNLVNCTKPKGTLAVSIDAHNHNLLKHLFRVQPADILHPHQYDLEEYSKMLTDLNCSIVQTELIKKEFLFNHYVLVATKE